jgi:hypothetical protein
MMKIVAEIFYIVHHLRLKNLAMFWRLDLSSSEDGMGRMLILKLVY